MSRGDYVKLGTSILICELTGVLDSTFTSQSLAGWYSALPKPFFNPPNWIFAPVWTLLYLLIGVALFFVWRKQGVSERFAAIRRKAFWIFGGQMFLNVLWTAFFFGFKNVGAAFFEIIALWLAIAWMMAYFHKVSTPAFVLLFPYWAWVTYAAILNYAIWMLTLR